MSAGSPSAEAAPLEGPALSGPAPVQGATGDAATKITTCSVLGLPLLASDYAGAVQIARAWAQTSTQPRLIAAANTHVATLARHDRAFGETMANFDLILPDGMPLIWVMNRRLLEPLRDRIYGPTFMLHCLEATARAPASDGAAAPPPHPGDQLLLSKAKPAPGAENAHMFVGGTPELLAQLQERLLAKFPSLQIAGTYAPPFAPWPEGEDERIIEAIRASGARWVWIGLGCPKQERWLARHREQLPPAVYGAVGAAFAFHAGMVRQAPRWMQQHGLEGCFGSLPSRADCGGGTWCTMRCFSGTWCGIEIEAQPSRTNSGAQGASLLALERLQVGE